MQEKATKEKQQYVHDCYQVTFVACGLGIRNPSDLAAYCYKGLPELGICVSEPVLAVAEAYAKTVYTYTQIALAAELGLIGGPLDLGEAAVFADDAEAAAIAKALSRLPKAARQSPKPPEFDPRTWQWRAASRNIPEKHWWDPKGGEWRYHSGDKWHDPHWDYNPWTEWNSPWQHIYPK